MSQSDAASYTVGLTNAAGGVLSSAATLTVIDPPEITSQPASGTNNAGDSVPIGNATVTFNQSSNLIASQSNVTINGGARLNLNGFSNTIATPGERDFYSFTGAIGQRLYYDALDADGDSINVQLIAPSGALRPECVPRWRQPEQQSGEQRDSRGEKHDVQIGMHLDVDVLGRRFCL